MTLTQVWGLLLILIVCPLLGGLPLIAWLTFALTGKNLRQLGTGNVSVSAAFYHGGKVVGILGVLSEAFKGIAAVLLARYFFPTETVWELVALIALIMGRFWMGKGAGTTNVVWGMVVHDPITAALVFFLGGISFTILRQRESGRISVLILLPLVLGLRHSHEPERIWGAIALSGLIFWIYQQIPDDLDLPATEGKVESQKMFRFFRGDRAIISLNQKLDPAKVGEKAANLSQLKSWGYNVPPGWVLLPGDDSQPLVSFLQPSEGNPLVVRSSALGEDSVAASAAGQYLSVLNVTDKRALSTAILNCLASYNIPAAIKYRDDRSQEDTSMAVLVQKQIQGVFSGVAFSRDPVDQLSQAVVIEALPGDAVQVVSGQVTPQQYRVYPQKLNSQDKTNQLRDSVIEGTGDVPPNILQKVAKVARELEKRYHGIPQDIEWTYDGKKLWLLQTRPITTLYPIWTRKIAAEVIPGVIRPLTWSINRPLTCGVWGDIFTLVLGDGAKGLDFKRTATLHYQRAYFNATLLGEIFRRMGLPPESLAFLTRGEKFSKPPLSSTLRNLPGLLRLLKRELSLEKDFDRDYQLEFARILVKVNAQDPDQLSPTQLLERVDTILLALKQATYYSILAPLSLAIRQGLFKVDPGQLDNSSTPEVEAVNSLATLAANTRNLLPMKRLASDSCPALFAQIAEMTDGTSILEQFDQWLERYGYLSEAATDIAIPRWQEDPRPVRELFARFLLSGDEGRESQPSGSKNWRVKLVQRRLDLKSLVTEIYSQLLAHLRFCFVAIEKQWLTTELLAVKGDIFFLKIGEIRRLITEENSELRGRIPQLIAQRRSQFKADKKLATVPYLVYGNTPASSFIPPTSTSPGQRLQGIGASPGRFVGRVRVARNLQNIGEVDKETVLVVPYTDSGWSLLLSQAGGLIAEVGGRLSHGAIVAREYGIPAVMDIHDATQIFQDGQQVLIDGQSGIVETMNNDA